MSLLSLQKMRLFENSEPCLLIGAKVLILTGLQDAWRYERSCQTIWMIGIDGCMLWRSMGVLKDTRKFVTS